jgi:hypothetical protein
MTRSQVAPSVEIRSDDGILSTRLHPDQASLTCASDRPRRAVTSIRKRVAADPPHFTCALVAISVN